MQRVVSPNSFAWMPTNSITMAVEAASRLHLQVASIEGRQGQVIVHVAAGAAIHILNPS